MSSSNRGLFVVLGLGIVAGLGFALYYVLVMGPADERSAMQGQIRDWAEQKWLPLRRCLVGDEPMVQNGRDALILRLAVDPVPHPPGACDAAMADLARPPGPSSGRAEVEAGWKEVRVGAALLSNRYAGRSLGDPHVAEEVGEAIEKLDATYAALRRDAGMDAAPPAGAATVATLPAGTALPVDPPRAVMVEASRIVLESRGPRLTRAVVRGPDAVEVQRAEAGLPAAGGDWEAWVEQVEGGYGLFAGDPRATERTPIHQLGWDRGDVLYAAQEGPRRLIAMVVPMALGDVLLVLEGDETSWTPRVVGDVDWYVRTASGRLDLFVDLAPGTGWVPLGPTGVALPEPLPLPGRSAGSHCATGDGLWYVDANQFLGRLKVGGAPPARAPAPDDATRIAGCAPDRAVFRAASGDRLYDCTLASCQPRFRFGAGLRPGPVGANDGTLRFIGTAADDLLLYWDGPEAEPRPLRVAGEVRPLTLARLGGVTQLLMVADGAVRLAPLP